MKRKYSHLFFFTIFLVFLMSFTSGSLVLAIGPGTGGSKIRVNDQEVGPFILLVATSPLPVTLDQQMSIWVRVSDNKTEQLRREATVMVEAAHREAGHRLTAQATHQNAGNDYDYVAHFAVEDSGPWDITVHVEDALGQADVSFTETVSRGLSAKLLLGLGVPFVVLAIVIGIYLWRHSAAP